MVFVCLFCIDGKIEDQKTEVTYPKLLNLSVTITLETLKS